MRPTHPLSLSLLLLLPTTALQIPSLISDFYAPLDALLTSPNTDVNTTSSNLEDRPLELLKRDGNCPVNHNSCSTLGQANGGACCTQGTFCTFDKSHNIACCPSGASCTGTVTLGTGTAAGGSGAGAGGGGNIFGATTTSTPVFGVATTSTTPVVTAAATASYVPNAYFPFPYIPTTYVNSAACNTAYLACQTNLAACTNNLVGNAFGVTVVAPNGGGITVAPTQVNVGSASASSICVSLSAQACYNIQSSNCEQFGQGTETGAGFVVATAANGVDRRMGGMRVEEIVKVVVGLEVVRWLL